MNSSIYFIFISNHTMLPMTPYNQVHRNLSNYQSGEPWPYRHFTSGRQLMPHCYAPYFHIRIRRPPCRSNLTKPSHYSSTFARFEVAGSTPVQDITMLSPTVFSCLGDSSCSKIPNSAQHITSGGRGMGLNRTRLGYSTSGCQNS
jgi:hypothetical protein